MKHAVNADVIFIYPYVINFAFSKKIGEALFF